MEFMEADITPSPNNRLWLIFRRSCDANPLSYRRPIRIGSLVSFLENRGPVFCRFPEFVGPGGFVFCKWQASIIAPHFLQHPSFRERLCKSRKSSWTLTTKPPKRRLPPLEVRLCVSRGTAAWISSATRPALSHPHRRTWLAVYAKMLPAMYR